MEQFIKKIVVVGGGFAGLNLIKGLEGNPDFQITLVDTNNFHFFPPLLYQVATAFIEPSNISYPFRRMFQEKKNIRFFMGSTVNINPIQKILETDNGVLDYDYLVLAVGTETNFFGMENVEKHALPMKTIGDALNLRNQLLLSLEKASRATDLVERKRFLNIVIAGGGPSGVEVAGMLAEMGTHIAKKEYPEFSAINARIHLLDAAPVLLGSMSQKSQQEAAKVLSHLGVRIKVNTAVKDYRDGQVILANGESIPAYSLIWTSGVTGRELPGLPKEVIGHARRVKVDAYNQVINHPGIYAIGDVCIQQTEAAFPNGHPQLAQVAIQQGNLLAKNIKNISQAKLLKPFVYNDKGSMAIIAKYKAVVDLPKLFFNGYFAWLIWLFIHLIPIAGYRNKFKLAFNWFWSFITNNPTLRLIIRPRKPA